jgi:hypothetical protein
MKLTALLSFFISVGYDNLLAYSEPIAEDHICDKLSVSQFWIRIGWKTEARVGGTDCLYYKKHAFCIRIACEAPAW